MKVLAISGSLRADSFNTALLSAAQQYALGYDWDLAAIGDLPLYNQELDGDVKPASVVRFKEQIENADALVIATPEYNYGIPGGLKNAIDWASRPAYQSVLAHKPTVIMSASMSPTGGVRAQSQLRQVLGGTLTPVYPAPEFAVASAQQKFADGVLTDDETQRKLKRLMEDFFHWASR